MSFPFQGSLLPQCSCIMCVTWLITTLALCCEIGEVNAVRASDKMSAQDRWSARILGLPVFTRSFSDALLQTPFSNIAFVCSMEMSSGAEFVHTVAGSKSSIGSEVADRINQEPQQLEQFWSLALAAEKVFMQSAVTQLGFGLGCVSPVAPSEDQSRSISCGKQRPFVL